MLGMKYIPLLALLLTSCIPDGPEMVRKVKYYKDSRTGICFASNMVAGGRSATAVFSYVPCELIPADMLHTVKPEPED